MNDLLRSTKVRVAIVANMALFALTSLNGLAALGVLMVEFSAPGQTPPGWLQAWAVLPLLAALLLGAATATWMGFVALCRLSERK